MKLVLKIVGGLVALVVVAVAAVYAWASVETGRLKSRVVEIHEADFPIPFPLDDDERVALGLADEEAEEVALARALERGEHLVRSRYGCTECHGTDFSGNVMIDVAAIGRLFGPNLTSGRGGVTSGWDAGDWDRIVRHGVRPDLKPSHMPSEAFKHMSDQELSDIVAYIRAQPPVDNQVPPVTIGPLGKLLLATGQIVMAYDRMAPHEGEHDRYPPAAEASLEFGRHLASACAGCHRADFAGGKIKGGDPAWVPAANLTPHEEGLGRWTLGQFVTAMRDGIRPDGTALQAPMNMMMPYARSMTDVEIEALWAYLRSLPARPARP